MRGSTDSVDSVDDPDDDGAPMRLSTEAEESVDDGMMGNSNDKQLERGAHNLLKFMSVILDTASRYVEV